MLRWMLAAVLGLAVSASATRAQAGARPVLSVVVEEGSPVQELSLEELRQIFLGEQQYTKRHRITLLIPPAGSPERALVLRLVYRMDEAEFRRYWVRKLLRADVPSGPTVVRSGALARELVASVPGAIALVSGTETSPGVRLVLINGHNPQDPGYPLR